MKTGTTIILLFTALVGAGLFYARFIEPYRLEVRRLTISDPLLDRAWGRLKIVQLSDLHIDSPDRREAAILDYLAKIAPDLIVITGDLTQWGKQPDQAIAFVKKLRAPLGVYAVLGDADQAANRHRCRFCHPGSDYRKLRSNPHILRNQLVRLEISQQQKGRELFILGLGPAGEPETESEFKRLAQRLPQKAPVLVLSHFSRAWARIGATTDRPMLWLSGDTHGGQIRLPGWFWKRLKIKPDPDHMAGLFKQPGRHHYLYVSRGIGTTAGFPLRLGVRPEITVFRFEPGTANGKTGGKP
jgi:predicted MPP superfamily phosphohydrolase